jgi:Zn-dependent protease
MKIAAAGPVSNALFAMIVSVIYAFYGNLTEGNYGNSVQVIKEIFLYGIYINWGLFIFNLIPLPPLDGSHLLLNQFKRFPRVYDTLYKYGSYVFLGLILVTVFTDLNLFPIGPAMQFLARGFLSIIGSS